MILGEKYVDTYRDRLSKITNIKKKETGDKIIIITFVLVSLIFFRNTDVIDRLAFNGETGALFFQIVGAMFGTIAIWRKFGPILGTITLIASITLLSGFFKNYLNM